MTTNTQDAFERIVSLLNEAMLDDSRWPETSTVIDEATGARGSILTFGADNLNGDVDIFFARSYYRGTDRSHWHRAYFRDYHATDEDRHLLRLRALPDSKIVHVREIFSEQELKTSRFYNEALVRFHGQNGLNVRLDGPQGSRIMWGIADPVDSSGWSSSRVDMIRRLLPHLRQYVRVRTALADAGALHRTLAELLGIARTGVVQLDRNGRIVAANDPASELLRRNHGLSDRNGALYAAAPPENAALQNLLARALPRYGEQARSGSTTVRRSSRLPRLAVHIKPVAHRELDGRSRNVAALALIVDPLERAAIDTAMVETVLGLSPAQAEIAVLLARGRTLRQISETTGRGYGTVRTHLKHIFARLGVSRQVDLANLVLALSRLAVSKD